MYTYGWYEPTIAPILLPSTFSLVEWDTSIPTVIMIFFPLFKRSAKRPDKPQLIPPAFVFTLYAMLFK